MTPTTAQLPPLRQDIEILQGAPDRSGASGWILHDPLQHRYFQIDQATRDLLTYWRPGTSTAGMARIAHERTGVVYSEAAVGSLADFLRNNGLAEETEAGAWRKLSARATAQREAGLRRIPQKLLFFRLPLLQPERLLHSLSPLVAPLYSPFAGALFALISLAGLYLVSRQWDEFTGTFQNFASLEGAAWFALSLFFMKAVHELGHAFTALRYGCRVPSMGVAFMLLTPMLYTDVTDSWRLSSRRQRMHIGAAGVIVELALAGVAGFLWAFLDDPTARGIAFVVATSGWMMSLLVNLNPLMRYDGYYLFSDLIGVDNLQQRAYALGRWKLRQLLLAPSLAAPEFLPPARRRLLIGYAFASWLYRLFVVAAIAAFVYHFFIKLAGIALLVLEIWLMLILPIGKELLQWREIDRNLMSSTRMAAIGSLALLLLGLLIVPWSSRIAVPAVLVASDLTRIYPARPARIVEVSATRDQTVARGDTLLKLEVPEIESEIAGAEIRRNLLKQRLAQAMGDRSDRQQLLVLSQELGSLQTKLDGLVDERQDLEIRSPLSGVVLQTAANLHAGQWVGRQELLALLASGEKLVVKGYVDGHDVQRLSAGAAGRFIPDDITRQAFAVRLKSVAHTGAASIEIPELTSLSGGRIAVEPDASRRLLPRSAQYAAELEPVEPSAAPAQMVRGVVVLEGAPESLLARFTRQVLRIAVRESGF